MTRFGVAFAVFLAREWKRRDPPAAVKPVPRTDPGAVIETTGGHTSHVSASREDVAITSKRQSTYQDGTSKLEGVTAVFDEKNGTRTFTISGKEGRLGKGATTMVLDGSVRMEGTDGLVVLTEHASYSETDAVVRAPGAVEVTRGRRSCTSRRARKRRARRTSHPAPPSSRAATSICGSSGRSGCCAPARTSLRKVR